MKYDKPLLYVDVKVKSSTQRISILKFENHSQIVSEFCQTHALNKTTENYIQAKVRKLIIAARQKKR